MRLQWKSYSHYLYKEGKNYGKGQVYYERIGGARCQEVPQKG